MTQRQRAFYKRARKGKKVGKANLPFWFLDIFNILLFYI